MGNLFDLPFDDTRTTPAAPAPPSRRPRRGRRVYSVSRITQEIRDLLGTTWADVHVEGEISNLKVSGPGHVYFTLKDEHAQLRAVIFKSAPRGR